MKKTLLTLILIIWASSIFCQATTRNDSCDINYVKVYEDGTITWGVLRETKPEIYRIDKFVWDKWTKIGEVNSIGKPGPLTYTFRTFFCSGDNIFRVGKLNNQCIAKETKINNNIPKVTYSISKEKKEITFSSQTFYEILDSKGNIVKKGFGSKISLDNLSRDKYQLNFDSSTDNFSL